MIMVNELSSLELAMDDGRVSPAIIKHQFGILIQLLAPFAPFVAAELWELVGEDGVVFRAAWPERNEYWEKESEIEIPVQVNGKLVTVVTVAAESDVEAVKAAAMAEEKVQGRIAGKTVVKVIVVPGKLVNLVVK